MTMLNRILGRPDSERPLSRIQKGDALGTNQSTPQGDDPDPSSPTGGEYLKRIRELANDLEKFELDIERALVYANGSHTYADVVAGVMQGQYHFYPLEHSFIMCEVAEYPQKRTYHIFLAGGSLTEIVEFEPILRQNAAILGCSHLTLAGRIGWSKALKNRGWDFDLAIMSKEVK